MKTSLRRSCDRGAAASPVQPGLFDELWTLHPKPQPERQVVAQSRPARQIAKLTNARKRAPGRPAPRPRMVCEADLPVYPEAHVRAVEQAIAAIRTDRVLLGYKDVKDFFGVSKATANRRMKEGLVPGIRILDGEVLRDGGVRRFSREQVKWLLLAVRHTPA